MVYSLMLLNLFRTEKNMISDSLIFNPPISSPLHPQLNLPLLKAFLGEKGYKARIVDSNIDFFHEFLGEDIPRLDIETCYENPLSILDYYNDLEDRLATASKRYAGLNVGLRSLSMRHSRISLDEVLLAITDIEGNPFISFFDRLIKTKLQDEKPKIVGIAITFQDQIIPGFTLANIIRNTWSDAIIVMGGQIITRCWETIVDHPELPLYADYLALWDGEIPFLQVHEREMKGVDAELTNLIDLRNGKRNANRLDAVLPSPQLPKGDFSDIDFSKYLFPEFLVPMQTTRGCYAKCAFCAIPFGSNKYRVRDAKMVADEIEEIQEHTLREFGHKATLFKFMEDTSSPSMLLSLSEEIVKRGLDVKWETFARLEKAFASKEVMDQLFAGGCRKIHWGLETNDPYILGDMNKKTDISYTDPILRYAGEAGILNFCFVLVGFPGETDEMRTKLREYIVGNENIHTITLATFDLTRKSPMAESFTEDNQYGLDCIPAEGFQVRLPYTVNGLDWKKDIVGAAHQMILEIIRERPDIGLVTLFPDQIRALFCDRYGNNWGREFAEKIGKNNVAEMLVNTEKYVTAFKEGRQVDISMLPEPLKREHNRSKEDIAMIANAVLRRRDYETRRIDQV